jgi:hypothetical protein
MQEKQVIKLRFILSLILSLLELYCDYLDYDRTFRLASYLTERAFKETVDITFLVII